MADVLPTPGNPEPSTPVPTGAGSGGRPAQPASPSKEPPFLVRLMLVSVFAFLALLWGYNIVTTLVSSIQANQGHPGSLWADIAFLPAVLLVLLNYYCLYKKTSGVPLPILAIWIAAHTSHGQSTIGPVIGLVCFFLDPMGLLVFAGAMIFMPIRRFSLTRKPKG